MEVTQVLTLIAGGFLVLSGAVLVRCWLILRKCRQHLTELQQIYGV